MPVRRPAKRFRRRMPCEIQADGRQQRAIVIDVSRSGLFVQTSARLAPGSEIGVALQVEGSAELLRLRVRVARQKAVPSNLTSVAQGGVGLRILQAPPAYYALLDEQEGVATALLPTPRDATERASSAGERANAPSVAEAATPRFRVRVKQSDGPRSRVIDVHADSAEQARSRALAKLGQGWEVVDATGT